MELNKIYQEPCLETLSKMPDEYLDCVITSPPYWQLRDYGYEGQWGLEPTYQEYLENLWSMMDEIYRVLKPSGTVWVNLGDTYGGNNSMASNNGRAGFGNPREKIVNRGISKCLMLIPHRFAIGCIDRGWIVRNDIIWAKRNGMPDSVTDRFTKKHEYIFFMVKEQKYYFDLDSIRDKIKTEVVDRKISEKNDVFLNEYSRNQSKYESVEIESKHRQGMHKERGNNIIIKRNELPTQDEMVTFLRERTTATELSIEFGLEKTKIEHWFRMDKSGFSYPSIEDWANIKDYFNDGTKEYEYIDYCLSTYELENDDINKNQSKGKNPSDVSDFWDITTKGTSAQHYASYNDELIRKPILAGCPEGGIIYDPFMGTGSTAEAALRANRKFIGSEMSEKYVEIANQRLSPFLTQLNLF